MAYETILYEVDGPVLTITLNRPDKLNAFDAATHKAFAGALKEAAEGAVRGGHGGPPARQRTCGSHWIASTTTSSARSE